MFSNNRKIGRGFENLEGRRMMAYVGIDGQGDLLIDCQPDRALDNDVEVRSVGTDWQVTLNGIKQEPIAKSRAWSGYIECILWDGNDDFQNFTTLMADVNGGSGNDHLIGGSRHDRLIGGEGNDTLEGLGGDDVLYGDGGSDWLTGDDGNDYLNGGIGDDTLYGHTGNDTLDGNSGNDWLYGWTGDDTLYGSWGNDTMYGEGDNDTIYGEGGVDWINAGTGNDYAHGGTENDTIYGDLGNDVLDGYAGNDTIYGWYGDDTLCGSNGNDKLYGEYDNDTLYGEGGDDWINAGEGNDYVHGGTENDTIYGDLGNDVLDGFAGNDTIYGSYGDDTLFGSLGNDKLYGEYDNDKLYGESGNDLLNGNSGDDTYFFDADSALGSDYIYDSQGGIDTLDFSATSVAVGVDLSISSEYAQMVNGNHTLTFTVNTAIENLFGGAGSDTLLGNSLNNVIKGGDGDDKLYGRGGNDTLYGDAGNDGLFGGVGSRNILYGGAGADRFLDHASNSTELDYIRDRTDADAIINFRNGEQITTSLATGSQETYSGGVWTDTEIQNADKGLAYLHTKTGNTKLLRFGTSDGMTYVRQGRRTDRNDQRVLGWNDGQGTQFFTDSGMPSVDATVVHEIAHNWDDPGETPFATEFRDKSMWRASQTPTNSHTRSGDGLWYWQTSTANTFARDYGKTNPFEDWATTWEAVYARDRGINPQHVAINAQKTAVIDDFFASLA